MRSATWWICETEKLFMMNYNGKVFFLLKMSHTWQFYMHSIFSFAFFFVRIKCHSIKMTKFYHQALWVNERMCCFALNLMKHEKCRRFFVIRSASIVFNSSSFFLSAILWNWKQWALATIHLYIQFELLFCSIFSFESKKNLNVVGNSLLLTFPINCLSRATKLLLLCHSNNASERKLVLYSLSASFFFHRTWILS